MSLRITAADMLKRTVDIVAAGAGLILTSPIFVVAAIAVKGTSPGPVFHRALRVGRDGSTFCMFKFRTMFVAVEEPQSRITRSHDPRVTKMGQWLRKTKIDELPQLLNVLRGDMSLVGPRPEDARYVALYSDRQRRVLTVRPGITSLASVKYRDEEKYLIDDTSEQTYISQIMPAKLELDLQYIDNSSLGADLCIIARTLGTLLRGYNSYTRQ